MMNPIDKIKKIFFGPQKVLSTVPPSPNEFTWTTDLEMPDKKKHRLYLGFQVEDESGPILTIKFPCGNKFMLQTARPPAMQDMSCRRR